MRGRDEHVARRDMGCTEARLAISARADGEPFRCDVPKLEDHLRRCPACRHFELACSGERPELVVLARRLWLRSSRPVPPQLVAQLASLRDEDGRSPRRAGGVIRSPHRPRLSWAGAALPLAAFAAVLPLALARPPLPAATHVPTPCTIGLAVGHGYPH